ncbi:SDR family oxidoreductase [Gordonia sp. zg691]|uniref:SDR family NAD(P)-dependent oxidoreductase n=1 Tax=Gordonia jinghuaiqii TaxID=2758710 RepID=UPI0016628BBB|nr:SDR family NAD(P)-dependent oxidoreductase [Gordonia jinghuaiqii]MBD0859772.1 SDR family oxidoreductase [Gordonia jinghuaiqii]
MTDPFRLDGKVALITGGTKGIGLEVARLFRDRGADVMICGRTEKSGRATADEYGLAFHRADVTDEDAVRDLIGECESRYGRLDVLVNNAGPTDLLHTRDVDGPIGEVTLEAWHRLMDRTLTCSYLTTHHALDSLVRTGAGSIINISSIAAAQAMPGFDVYAAGKAGLEAMTRSVAIGYAHLGVRCNAIRVGTIAVDHGDQNRRLLPTADTAPDAWRRAEPPAAGAAEDVANAALFLAAPSSAYVTGVVLPVDGGLGARSLMPWQTPRPEATPRVASPV